MSLLLESGALATSGVRPAPLAARRPPDAPRLRPAPGPAGRHRPLRATAVAPTCAEADALATALLVAGAREAPRLADGWGVPAALVAGDGSLALAGGLR